MSNIRTSISPPPERHGPSPRTGPPVGDYPSSSFLRNCGLLLVRLGAGDPSLVPSVVIGKPAPQFALEPLEGLPRLVHLACRAPICGRGT